jgi:hypothetical protein
MKTPYEWDNYSDQPYQLKDKEYKKKMRRYELFSLLQTLFTALIMLPVSLMMMPFIKRKTVDSKTFFSMGVDFEREPERSLELLDELKVEAILLRLKLWEMEKLESLKSFIEANKNRKIILKIMQDREHVQDLELTKKDLRSIFTSLDTLVTIYEIGTTINRAKWGFFSVNEYLRFYQVAYDLQQSEFPHIQLIGSGVIDFEYHFTAHTLFHFYKQKFNGVSSLLYVDRRGAPENLQMGFDLSDKIALLSTMVWLSPKSGHSLHITETNWPISNTAPYAPTSEHECVSEDLYADYMLRYHLLAFASQQVESVSWHQLIAPGYGLIDNREGLRKRSAFNVYKYMVQNLNNAQFLRLDIERGYYIFQCLTDEKLLQIHWSFKPTTLQNEAHFEVYSSSGILIEDKTLNIGSSPLYIHIKDGV